MPRDDTIRAACQRAIAETPRGIFYKHRVLHAAKVELEKAGIQPQAIMATERPRLNEDLRAFKDATKERGSRYVVA